MKKRVLWGVLAVLIILAASVSASMGESAVPEAKSLSLNQAIELAMKDNAQVELAGLGVEKAALELERKEFAKRKALNKIGTTETNMLGGTSVVRIDQSTAKTIDVDPVLAQSQKIVADVTKSYTENSIKYGVEAAYYGVLRSEKMLETAQSSFKRAQEQLKQAQAKFKAGTVAKIDVISAEAELQSAEASVNEAEAGLQKAKMNLNQTLNLDLDTPLNLTDKFTFTTGEPIDVAKVIQEMMEKDKPFVAAREANHSSEVTMDYYKKYYTANTFDYRSAAYAYKDAEVAFNTAKSNLELNIKAAYLDLKTAEDNYKVLTKSLEQAQEAYRLTKLRYDVGMATGYDVLNAEASLKQADLGLLNALYNYNLAKAKFTYGIFGSSSM
ncbi:TolC family protein [Candidatus Formimonas warabiya]|uniref:TolC family protein n=1 Tax=Formimonas warabiya TaxID=1761012 RepID=A0A3G1KTX0_FORW1|nr:TolC family protein [Candidatus Formimonas warabiya]ATW25953.1 hypothetical protein DCMF_15265 [Candidatus Formimonas warabiya]